MSLLSFILTLYLVFGGANFLRTGRLNNYQNQQTLLPLLPRFSKFFIPWDDVPPMGGAAPSPITPFISVRYCSLADTVEVLLGHPTLQIRFEEKKYGFL